MNSCLACSGIGHVMNKNYVGYIETEKEKRMRKVTAHGGPPLNGAGKFQLTDPKGTTIVEEKVTSTSLIRPGDITDAIDSRDLLETLVTRNIDAIEEKVFNRERTAWVQKEKGKLRKEYLDRATKAYTRIWATCSKSSVGHNNTRIDAGGFSINQCEDCKQISPLSAPSNASSSTNYDFEKREADSRNLTMIKALSDRMIELDQEAGLFEWPTEDDYPKSTPLREEETKKKRFNIKW